MTRLIWWKFGGETYRFHTLVTCGRPSRKPYPPNAPFPSKRHWKLGRVHVWFQKGRSNGFVADLWLEKRPFPTRRELGIIVLPPE